MLRSTVRWVVYHENGRCARWNIVETEALMWIAGKK